MLPVNDPSPQYSQVSLAPCLVLPQYIYRRYNDNRFLVVVTGSLRVTFESIKQNGSVRQPSMTLVNHLPLKLIVGSNLLNFPRRPIEADTADGVMGLCVQNCSWLGFIRQSGWVASS